jgi:predicted alpha/beta-hydrolase family hydrolase
LRSPDELRIAVEGIGIPPGAATTALVYRAEQDQRGAVLVLGHGAGAGQRSGWMVDFAGALCALGLDVVTFNFLYTERQRRAPDRRPLLDACCRAVIQTARQQVAGPQRSLFAGGKSMGGRIATHVAAEHPNLNLSGIVLLGYPLHPPGRPDERRDAHLPAIGLPMLFVQGSHDTFGTPEELQLALTPLSPPATLHVVEGGDHSFKIRKKDPGRQAALLRDAHRAIVEWIRQVNRMQE